MGLNPQPRNWLGRGAPIVDPKTGRPSREFEEALMELFAKTDPTLTRRGQVQSVAPITGRTEGIGTTVQQLTPAGLLVNADQVAADGPTYGRVNGTALTANNVDLTKNGVVGPLGTPKIDNNMPLNATNNATVDSINAGASATARVYGPGGVGSNWVAFKGSLQTSLPSGSVTGLAYSTNYYIYWNGSSFQSSTTAFLVLPDGFIFAGLIMTVASAGSAAATATAVLAGTGVASVTITNVGAGYATPPTVAFTGGGGTGATGTAVLTGNTVTSVTMTSAGTGYTSAPGVTFNGGGGAGAAGTAVLVPTSIAQVTINTGGAGYSTAPTVSFTGGGGAGATATATISGGAVTGATIGNAGAGYTSAPAVGFGGGQAGTTGGGTVTGAGTAYRGGGRLAL